MPVLVRSMACAERDMRGVHEVWELKLAGAQGARGVGTGSDVERAECWREAQGRMLQRKGTRENGTAAYGCSIMDVQPGQQSVRS